MKELASDITGFGRVTTLKISSEREREGERDFLFNWTFTQGLKIIGEKVFHLAYAAYPGLLLYPQLALLLELQHTWVYPY